MTALEKLIAETLQIDKDVCPGPWTAIGTVVRPDESYGGMFAPICRTSGEETSKSIAHNRTAAPLLARLLQ